MADIAQWSDLIEDVYLREPISFFMVDLYEENRPWFEAKFVEMVQDVNGGLDGDNVTGR